MDGGAVILEAEVVDRVRELRNEVGRLERLRGELVGLETLLLRVRARARTRGRKRFGPTDAIRTALRDGPKRMSEVVELVSSDVESTSVNLRRTIYTTIGSLRRKGSIVEGEDGLLELTKA